MDGKWKDPERARIEDWELELLKKVCSVFRTPNRDELEAELAARLLKLKMRGVPHVRDWRAYLSKFFYNKAHNFVRDERARARRLTASLGELPSEFFQPAFESHLLLDAVVKDLSVDELRLWSLLVELDGNQSEAARRLGIHRNTVRLKLARIRAVLIRHEV